MRHIPGRFETERGFEIAADTDQWFVMVDFLNSGKVCNIIFRLRNYRHHPLQDTPVGAEKINQGGGENKNKAADKSTKEEKDLGSFYEFFCLKEMGGFEKIEYQETQRYQGIIYTEF